tara:strand:- start:3354 stop:3584 length:231 start_codon:yes stop_codon:yes gene_type:complete
MSSRMSPSVGIISNFNKLKLPSEKPMKTKGNGMMNRAQSSYTNNSKQDDEPVIKAKRIQMYIRSKNPKRGDMNESV